jgi:type II secretory pathway pseudopilin PulG
MRRVKKEDGFTIAELVIGMVVMGTFMLSVIGLFVALVSSSVTAKRKAVALSLATNQIEYLKLLPYDKLAVAGGSIPSTTPIPATKTDTLNNVTYTTTTSINYVDDAYDGCGPYPNVTLKNLYCRNQPAPTGAPATDLNPADYKVMKVVVKDPRGIVLVTQDTQISARVAETSSTTGSVFVTVLDSNGNPVSGAIVTVANTTIVPVVNASDSTDANGVAIFYSLVPDITNNDYTVSATKTDFSSLSTLKASGSLSPTYGGINVFAQQSSSVTLTLNPKGPDSMLLEAVSTSGTPLSGLKTYVKGGYKKYVLTTDTQYYFDTLSPTDVRPTTDSGGIIALSDLNPGPYFFCGDAGATSCSVGGTTYYVAAALPYSGTNSFNPAAVPNYVAATPPTPTYNYSGDEYYQKVRLVMTTDSTFPRISKLTPDDVSLAAPGLSTFSFQITGVNLPCSTVAASCTTVVSIIQGATTLPASCTGTSGLVINCTTNVSTLTVGRANLRVVVSGKTLDLSTSTALGGFDVTP